MTINRKNLRFNGVALVQTYPNSIKNLVCVTNTGAVRVVQLHDLSIESQTINVHLGECHLVTQSIDGKHLFTAGSDGVIFVFRVSEHFHNKKGVVTEDSQDHPKIEELLAQIVLVNKSLMVKWREEQDVVRIQMEEESNKVESSLRSEKYEFEKQIAKMEKLKTDELNELNRKYEQLQLSEAEQKDENT